jgi:hypothetical protein
MSEKAKKSAPLKKVRVNRVYPENLTSHLVSNMVVQHQPDLFILSFFEVWPPAVLGETEEEVRKEVAAINQLDIKCVARLAVTPARMREFVAALTENLRKFEEQEAKK